MKLLLDTSIFLWYVSGDKKLKPRQKSAIQNPKNEVYVSVVSIWEVCIKQLNGKLKLPEYAGTYLPRVREAQFFSA
jgi:PIN domain nuclease of toxin-antitoxin system